MATRTNAHEERLATLRSVMNVIAILDQTSPKRAAARHGFDLRPLLPHVNGFEGEDSWDEFWLKSPGPSRSIPGTSPLG